MSDDYREQGRKQYERYERTYNAVILAALLVGIAAIVIGDYL